MLKKHLTQTSFSCFYCYFEHNSHLFSRVSIVNSEQVYVSSESFNAWCPLNCRFSYLWPFRGRQTFKGYIFERSSGSSSKGISKVIGLTVKCFEETRSKISRVHTHLQHGWVSEPIFATWNELPNDHRVEKVLRMEWLTHSAQCCILYRNQISDLQCKSNDWFLHVIIEIKEWFKVNNRTTRKRCEMFKVNNKNTRTRSKYRKSDQ